MGLVILLVAGAFVIGSYLGPGTPSDSGIPVPAAGVPGVSSEPAGGQPVPPVLARPVPGPPSVPAGRSLAREAWALRAASDKVQGTVVDASGRPVAGASIELRQLLPGAQEKPLFGAMLAAARSAPDGAFGFAGVIRVGERYALRAQHPEYALSHFWPVDALLPASLSPRMTLGAGAAIRGTVTDDRRNPVAGARVLLFDAGTLSLEAGGLAEREAATDAAGAFVLDHVIDGTKRIVVRSPGLAVGRREPVVVQEARDLGGMDFMLGRGLAIAGTAVDSDSGRPAGGETLQLKAAWSPAGPDQPESVPGASGARLAAPPASFLSPVVDDTVVTGPDGRFRFEGVEERAYQILVANAPPGQPMQVVRAGVTDVVVKVQPQAAIEGTVTGVGGVTITRFAVVASRSPTPLGVAWNRRVRCEDPAGRFTLSGLSPGTWYVLAEAPEHARASAGPFHVGRGERVSGIGIRLEAGGVVTGRVKTGAGAPVAGARVTLQQDGEGPASPFEAVLRRATGARAETRTLEDGSYVFPGVDPGSWRVEASHELFAPAAASGLAVTSAAECLAPDLVVEAAAGVQGVVFDRNGHPDHLAVVMVTPDEPGVPAVQASTDGEGRFVVRGLRAGAYRIVAIQFRGTIHLDKVLENRNSGGSRTTLLPGEIKNVEIREE